ncbi:MAG: GNAT family N-acetyltransferase, partial [Malacoplasma sp.]|nr:GNAT family N-acetyltransferase [Malacoplasma sp.]
DNLNYFNEIYFKNELAGFFSFYQTSIGYEIDSLFVFDKFQNIGIGSFVIEWCINSVDCDVFLYVFKENKAFNLYKKMGFQIVKEINNNRYLMVKKTEIKI